MRMKTSSKMRIKLPGTRKFKVTVVRLDGRRATRSLKAMKGQLLTPLGLEAALKHEAERVEQYFPGLEFRLVPLRDGNFNFVEIAPIPAVEMTPEMSDRIYDVLQTGSTEEIERRNAKAIGFLQRLPIVDQLKHGSEIAG
jgi:hypothetical protein